jgi:hypothetical protein
VSFLSAPPFDKHGALCRRTAGKSDIVGYSLLMGADDEGTLGALKDETAGRYWGCALGRWCLLQLMASDWW